MDFELNIALYSEADACFRKGRYREALRLFKRAARADPLDSDCWFAIGSCLDALNRPTRAETAYLKALSMAPEEDHPALYFNIGNALLDQQRFEAAESWYARVPAEHEVFVRADRNRRLAESMAKRST
ncbi:MAG: tetratricopeptide repeat protein [Xanthomonadales bacterium]|nr:tetratricopeptide repeat protein [Xanthomonadales bacterium]